MLPLRKLMVPTDFSEPSYRGVKAADELARHFGAELILIHVVSSSQFVPPVGPPVPSGYQLSTLVEELMEAARRPSRKKRSRASGESSVWLSANGTLIYHAWRNVLLYGRTICENIQTVFRKRILYCTTINCLIFAGEHYSNYPNFKGVSLGA